MEKKIFTAADAAHHLGIAEKKVIRLADHGEIEGRKIDGKWFFSKADIVLRFEKNLEEMVHEDDLETIVDFAEHEVPSETVVAEPTVSGLLTQESILLPFAARTKDSVIRELVAVGERLGKIWVPEKMIDALRKREEMLSTAMECGVAFLHPRRPMPDVISESFLILGISLRGIPFGGGFNNLTDIFFLLCAEDDQTHLRLLAAIGRLLAKPGFLAGLRELESPREVLGWIKEMES